MLNSSPQHIHMKMQWKADRPWYLTVVYGAPQFTRRQQLWDVLEGLSTSVSGQWAVIGDFNCTLS